MCFRFLSIVLWYHRRREIAGKLTYSFVTNGERVYKTLRMSNNKISNI